MALTNSLNIIQYNIKKMEILRISIKAFLFFCATAILAPFYFFILFLLYRWRCIIGSELLRFYSKICLFIFRINISCNENYSEFSRMKKNLLIVSNHSSFLDIFVLSYLFRAVFVSKSDIKFYPVIGQIAWLMGVIFLERSSSKDRYRLIKKLSNICSKYRLVIFPQGTTSRLSDKKPFNRGVFKVLEINPDIKILPVSIIYENDYEIAWHTPQTLIQNAFIVFKKKRINVEVLIHEPIIYEKYSGYSSSQICNIVQEIVLSPSK